MKNILVKIIFATLIIHFGCLDAQAQWQSSIVYYDSTGKLVYVADSEGNRIPDFSYAGYKGGGVAIPDIPVVHTISPIAGDNTLHIQQAIDLVGAMPINQDGFRGALLLTAGTYEVYGVLRIKYDGVVLRGAGDGDNHASNSIIYGRGNSPNQRSIIIAGGGNSNRWNNPVGGTQTNIITDTIYVGSRTFEVENISPYQVGDNIIIFHPSTDAWLSAIDYGGTHYTESGAEPGVDLPWAPGNENIAYNRYITNIDGNKITIDAPVYNTLVKSLSQSYIFKYSRFGLKTNIGIENLRIDIETAGGTDEAHAWQSIDLYQIEDAWVRNCTMLHFGQSAVRTSTASRITVQDCNALDPISKIEGERRYNYQVYTASQQILFVNCHASNGRHHFVSNGYSYTSGCVFLKCTSQGAYTSSEGHRRWSQGLLFDSITELDGPRPGLNPRLLGLYNRGYYGTSHGWAIAHSVAWNYNAAAGDIIVQKPPTAQNYAIGCFGNRITGLKPPAEFSEPEGFIEGSNTPNLNPSSLYLAQLQERLGITSINSEKNQIPAGYVLNQNYPNPFNPETKIKFSIPQKENVKISIYNLLGEEVQILINLELLPGEYTVDFTNNNLPSGIYLYNIIAGVFNKTMKMVLLK